VTSARPYSPAIVNGRKSETTQQALTISRQLCQFVEDVVASDDELVTRMASNLLSRTKSGLPATCNLHAESIAHEHSSDSTIHDHGSITNKHLAAPAYMELGGMLTTRHLHYHHIHLHVTRSCRLDMFSSADSTDRESIQGYLGKSQQARSNR
jgi:hypothetical protein